MNPEDGQIQELAEEHSVAEGAVRDLLAALRGRAGSSNFYVYWTRGKAAGPSGAQRTRTLLAFLTPDAALAFAQHNQLNLADRPRLRRLSLLQILQATLREPAIEAILFVAERDVPAQLAGHLPTGVRVDRADLVRALHSSSADRTDTQRT